MAETNFEAPLEQQVVIVTRTVNAPRNVVFKTVTDPLLVPEWWGPRNLATTVYKMIVVPGGIYRFLQRDRDGVEHGFHGVYHEVVRPERLVYTMEYEGMPGHPTLNIDIFEEQDGKTVIRSRTIYMTIEDRDQMLQRGMENGVIETTNRLNELLATHSNQIREDDTMAHRKCHDGNGKGLKITRVFNAPIEEVWNRWTDPNEYKCWWGPKNFTAPYAKIDFRPGGKYLSSMRDPDGREYWSTGVYREIVEPNRIVYTDSFADEHGNIVDATYYGMPVDIPREMEVEVEFEDLGDKTRMTLEHCGFPDGEQLENAKAGWNESFDKLEECLG